ncbi:hypothetical protein RJ640_000776 [Escallonia rubra]|uniref:Retroviral polymerase SH3-like domain-containing protein n=1 Tax=Escallonia rubra TaxID=112253 RepID=A0AA88RSW5_9ASTE|nr:hypothetical protein RJ640_000776 [Escallonia rubra]
MLMENFLRSKEYWQVVESGVREPAKDAVMTDAQKIELDGRKLKDSKAKIYLIQAIDRPILETILSKETSKDIWDSMKKKYQGSSRVKRARLQALRSEVSKAYKLSNLLTKKIVTSRNVVFDEQSTWDWNRQQPTPVIFDSDAEEKMQPTPVISMPENAYQMQLQ